MTVPKAEKTDLTETMLEQQEGDGGSKMRDRKKIEVLLVLPDSSFNSPSPSFSFSLTNATQSVSRTSPYSDATFAVAM